ncbi:MAG: hypothetical protein ACLFTU_01155 [Puniceicoccaceae bacterium]
MVWAPLALSAAAPADPMEQPEEPLWRQEGGRPPGGFGFFELEQSALFVPESDFDDGSGDFSENRFETTIAWNRFSGPNSITRLSAGYIRKDYDVGGAGPFAGSFGGVNALRAGGTFERPLNRRWSAFVSSSVSFQAAGDASLADGWNVPFLLGAGYLVNPELYVSAGVLGIFEAELGDRAIPILGVRWQPNDRFTLMTVNGVVATYKAGARKEWEWLASVLYETFVFAVDDLEGFEREQGVVSQEYVQTRLGLVRNIGEEFQVGLALEGRFFRRFEYHDDERKFDQFDVDPGVGLRISGAWRF